MSEPFRGSASPLTRQQLRAARFVRLHRDVYVLTPADVSLGLRVDAAVAAVPDAVVSHRTAARLMGLPVDDDGRIHLTRRPGAPASKHPGIRPHRARLPAADVVDRDGRRVTTPERTFLDLAAVLSGVDLVVLADATLRMVGRDRVERRLRKAPGVRGVRRARGALLQADPLSDSPAETKTRLILHAGGFTGLRHGLDVVDPLDGWLARPDLADEAAKVAIQYDGLVHLGDDPERRRFDIDRDEDLRRRGWQVVVLTAVDLRDPDRMVAKVAAAYNRASSVALRPIQGLAHGA
jgi:very-short-patch-repair endonuclease